MRNCVFLVICDCNVFFLEIVQMIPSISTLMLIQLLPVCGCKNFIVVDVEVL